MAQEVPAHKEEQSWVCPVCQAQIKQKNASTLSRAKRSHLVSRHPTFNLRLVVPPRGTKLQVIYRSEHLPAKERSWSCPICNKGLPALPRQDYLRAVTPRTLFHKAATGRKTRTNGVSVMQLNKHEKNREAIWSSHQVILLPREKGDNERGRVSCCGKCLARLGRVPTAKDLTCQQSLEKIKTNPWSQKMKRDWWNRLQVRGPQHATLFLEKCGWDQKALEDLLAPTCPDRIVLLICFPFFATSFLILLPLPFAAHCCVQ